MAKEGSYEELDAAINQLERLYTSDEPMSPVEGRITNAVLVALRSIRHYMPELV